MFFTVISIYYLPTMTMGKDWGTAVRARDASTSRAQVRYLLFIYCFFFYSTNVFYSTNYLLRRWAGIRESQSGLETCRRLEPK
jgi:hypothetical protein